MTIHIEIAEDKVITEIWEEFGMIYVSGNIPKCLLVDLKGFQINLVVRELIQQQMGE